MKINKFRQLNNWGPRRKMIKIWLILKILRLWRSFNLLVPVVNFKAWRNKQLKTKKTSKKRQIFRFNNLKLLRFWRRRTIPMNYKTKFRNCPRSWECRLKLQIHSWAQKKKLHPSWLNELLKQESLKMKSWVPWVDITYTNI